MFIDALSQVEKPNAALGKPLDIGTKTMNLANVVFVISIQNSFQALHEIRFLRSGLKSCHSVIDVELALKKAEDGLIRRAKVIEIGSIQRTIPATCQIPWYGWMLPIFKVCNMGLPVHEL